MHNNNENKQDINQYLKAEMCGRLITSVIMAAILIVAVCINKRKQDSAKMQQQVKEFVESLPNYTDSIRIFDEKNADDIQHLQNILNFLSTNPMQHVNQDSLQHAFWTKRATRQQLVKAQESTNKLKQQYLDSVQHANRFNLFVRKSSMQYPR